MNIKEKNEIKPLQERTFPNGLVIQELGMGKPDGRKATPGKKVKINLCDCNYDISVLIVS